jgi:hypothetical protein
MKRLVLWDFERGSWQYDLFCLLIVAFIFLTPKSWFERAEKFATQLPSAIVRHQYTPPTQ